MEHRKILVTSALPYANGSIHLGHLLETIQTDIWVRFQRMRGHTCHYVCADDAHGTTTMLEAEKRALSADAWIEICREEHLKDFNAFGISFDNYGSTHSEENEKLASTIYQRCFDSGFVTTKEVNQFFDNNRQMFLADRYVLGTCPICKAENQYGDNCAACGATYDATQLINPISTLSKEPPSLKKSTHYFLAINKCQSFLETRIKGGLVPSEVANKLNEWLSAGLKPWDISRDAPYFGFRIPNTDDKYFYVWVDAPIGYMASFKQLCDRSEALQFDEYWKEDSTTELYHFIGKDIINFHALFWPAMLHFANMRQPTQIHVHGMITVNGQKMSKSKGTFIKAATYLKHLDPAYLRYYYASKLNDNIEDIEINFEEFTQKVNTDLVGKVINIASRCAGLLHKKGGTLCQEIDAPDLWQAIVDASDSLATQYESRRYSSAIRTIMSLADQTNQYISQQAPWNLLKDPQQEDKLIAVCSMAINAFRSLIIYLKPVLPLLAEMSEAFLNTAPFTWQDSTVFLKNHRINKFKPLMKRMEINDLEKITQESIEVDSNAPKGSASSSKNQTDSKSTPPINLEQFLMVDLRIAQIEQAELIEGSKNLLRISLDVGDHKRQVISGIKQHYNPADIIGKYVVLIANLAPRKMRFGVSEGMLLAASGDEDDVFLLTADSGVKAGMKIS